MLEHMAFFSELEFLVVQPKFLVVFLFLINKTINYCRLVAVCLYLYGHGMNAIGEKVKVLKCLG
jgi:hypothetical protein